MARQTFISSFGDSVPVCVPQRLDNLSDLGIVHRDVLLCFNSDL